MAVIPLAASATCKAVVQRLVSDQETGARFSSPLGVNEAGSFAGKPVTVEFTGFKSKRFTFIEAARDLTSILDAAKVADSVLLVVPVGQMQEGCVDDLGILTINTLLNQVR